MTSDLEKEARAAADEIGRQVPWGNFPYMSRQHYINGYLAAAEPREKEIEALRAKLEAVPVGEMPDEDLTFHINRLERMLSHNMIVGDVGESVFALIVWARTHAAQPKVAMTEERKVYTKVESLLAALRWDLDRFPGQAILHFADQIDAAEREVRTQAAGVK